MTTPPGTQTPSCCDRRRRHARTPPAARNPPARCRFSVTAHPGGMPRRNATWKVRPGICYESLAFEVARREGLPESFIARSEQLYQSIIHKPPPPAAAFDASDPGLLAGQTTTGRTQQAGQSARGTPPPSHPGLGSEPDPGSGSADGGGGEGGCGAAGGMGASGRAAVQVRDHGTGSHWLARVGPRIIARRGCAGGCMVALRASRRTSARAWTHLRQPRSYASSNVWLTMVAAVKNCHHTACAAHLNRRMDA